MPILRMKAESDLKKYAKLNGYEADSYSTTGFMKHLALRFKISEYEIKTAVYHNKIRIYFVNTLVTV